jgi:hypothetical protein
LLAALCWAVQRENPLLAALFPADYPAVLTGLGQAAVYPVLGLLKMLTVLTKLQEPLQQEASNSCPCKLHAGV